MSDLDAKIWQAVRISELEAEVERLREALASVVKDAKEVIATAQNTTSVRKGFELSGYIKHYTVSRLVVSHAEEALDSSDTVGGE